MAQGHGLPVRNLVLAKGPGSHKGAAIPCQGSKDGDARVDGFRETLDDGAAIHADALPQQQHRPQRPSIAWGLKGLSKLPPRSS